jgi:biopolymer transport protein TolR
VLAVSVPLAGPLRVDGAALDDGALVARATSARAASPKLRAVIAADGAVAHARVMQVMGLLRKAGVVQIAFATAGAGPGTPGGQGAAP